MIAGSLGAYFGYFKPHKEAVDAYNDVVNDIQEKNNQLDGEIKKLQELVDNEDKPLDETTIDAAKENVGASKIVIGEMPKATKDILSRTKELSTPVDYSDELTALSTAYTNLENSKKQYKQVVNPSEEFVMQRILTVDDVADARAVTEDQDPNGTHTVIGTVLVRTSNELTATQQKELEQKVIDALTRLE